MRKRLTAALLIALATPALGASVGPDTEAGMIQTTKDFAARFDAAPNDMARGLVRADRGRALCAPPSKFISGQGAVRDWIGTVKTLDAVDDGRGILAVSISPEVTLKTTNNTFTESIMTETPTLIAARSPLFNAVVALSIGQKVRFSGNFWPSKVDCMQETSVTTEGSMAEPDYLFRFTAVAPAE